MTELKPGKEYEFNLKIELHFYELLRSAIRLGPVELTVPETFLFGYGFSRPTLICSDYTSGLLQCKESISKIGVLESFIFFEERRTFKGTFPIAIAKIGDSQGRDTCKALFSAQESIALWNRHVRSGKPIVLQRYVFNTNRQLALIKSTWRFLQSRVLKSMHIKPLKVSTLDNTISSYADLRKFSQGKMIESSDFLITQADIFSVQDLQESPDIDSKMQTLKSLIEKHYKATAIFIEADFIQDNRGIPFLINCKNYKLTRFNQPGLSSSASIPTLAHMNSSYNLNLPNISASKLHTSPSKTRLSHSFSKATVYREKSFPKPQIIDRVLLKRRIIGRSSIPDLKDRLNNSVV